MISVLSIFRVGLGPSSSHTVGPMRAGLDFVKQLAKKGLLRCVTRVSVHLMGSLAATGKGHGTDSACQLGLMGLPPETTSPDQAEVSLKQVKEDLRLILNGELSISFDPERDISFAADEVASFHTNAVDFSAYAGDELLYKRRFYSIGGGFVVAGQEQHPELPEVLEKDSKSPQGEVPYPYKTARDLIGFANTTQQSIADVVMANESVFQAKEQVNEKLDLIWEVMHASLERGLQQTEPLPGPLNVARRAKRLADELRRATDNDPLSVLDWVTAYAMAVSEENAAGGRVVTAPTNGAAGVVPAVIQYYLNHLPDADPLKVREFLLTAGAVGILYKENASISGAEVGCQGEVGVACSMAAAGLTAIMGGTVQQVENAAEIAMEHNLGLTCDPVAGQVQIPCIERNAIAAVKAICAARMALRGNGSHYISLDQVIRTMYETGKDMQSKYKETSQGGLAVCIVEC